MISDIPLHNREGKEDEVAFVVKGEKRYNSIAGLPIMFKEDLLGVVVVASQQANEISNEDFDNLKRYLHIIQLALLIAVSQNNKVRGGDEYASLYRIVQEEQSAEPAAQGAEEVGR